MNLVEYTVTEKTETNNVYTYKLSDSQNVNLTLTDSQIISSEEYKKLIEEGYTGEAALQKIKNKC
jgi:PKD repeat protein